MDYTRLHLGLLGKMLNDLLIKQTSVRDFGHISKARDDFSFLVSAKNIVVIPRVQPNKNSCPKINFRSIIARASKIASTPDSKKTMASSCLWTVTYELRPKHISVSLRLVSSN